MAVMSLIVEVPVNFDFFNCAYMGDIIWVLKEPVHNSLFWKSFQIFGVFKAFPSCNRRDNHCHESGLAASEAQSVTTVSIILLTTFQRVGRVSQEICLQMKTLPQAKRHKLYRVFSLVGLFQLLGMGGTKSGNLPTSVAILTSIFALMPLIIQTGQALPGKST